MSDVIEIRDLSRDFGKIRALDAVSLRVPPGIVLGLVGENGAGKTTLIKHLLGLLKPQTGNVEVFGRDPVRDPVGVLGRVGYLSEDRDLPDWMRIAELMRFTRAFYPAWDPAYAEQLLEMFDLDRRRRVKQLSRGQRARTGLLMALSHRPPLLVLDEPSSGLDPIVRRDILGAIIRTVADEGRNVLFSSHLLEEVERVADRVAMLHAGRVVLADSLDRILTTHLRVTVRFPTVPATPLAPAGALSCTGEGRERTCIANGDLERFRESVRQLGGEIVDQSAPSLEEIFLARSGA